MRSRPCSPFTPRSRARSPKPLENCTGAEPMAFSSSEGQPPSLPDPASTDVVDLTQAICDIESVSGGEKPLADAVHSALQRYAHLRVQRDGDTVIARTELGRDHRVVIAGHVDTVPT